MVSILVSIRFLVSIRLRWFRYATLLNPSLNPSRLLNPTELPYYEPKVGAIRLMMTKEISLLLSKSGAMWKGMSEVEIAADLLARGKLDAKFLITHKFPLDRISDAFHAALNKGESGAIKVLITY